MRDALLLGAALVDRGHSVAFVVGDPVSLVEQSGGWVPPSLFQSPQLKAPPQLIMKQPPIDGLADSIAAAGFDTKATLLTVAKLWHDQIALLDVDAILAVNCPALWLIGSALAPTFAMGSGLSLPPVLGTSFPRLSAESVPLADEGILLENANAIRTRYGLPSLATLGDLVTSCSPLLYGMPTFDPYLQLRRDVTLGVLGDMPQPSLPVAEQRFAAFLDAYCPGIETFVLALANLEDVGVDVHVSGSMAGARSFLEQQPGVRVWTDVRALIAQIPTATAVIHHGALDVAQRAIGAARPQLLLPWTPDQKIYAYMIGWMGLTRTLSPAGTIEQFAGELRGVLSDTSLAIAAQHHARQFALAGLPNALPALVDRIEQATVPTG